MWQNTPNCFLPSNELHFEGLELFHSFFDSTFLVPRIIVCKVVYIFNRFSHFINQKILRCIFCLQGRIEEQLQISYHRLVQETPIQLNSFLCRPILNTVYFSCSSFLHNYYLLGREFHNQRCYIPRSVLYTSIICAIGLSEAFWIFLRSFVIISK